MEVLFARLLIAESLAKDGLALRVPRVVVLREQLSFD